MTSPYDNNFPETEEDIQAAEKQIIFATELADKISGISGIVISASDILTGMKYSIFKIELNESQEVIHAANLLALDPEGWYQSKGGRRFDLEKWNLTLGDPEDLLGPEGGV